MGKKVRRELHKKVVSMLYGAHAGHIGSCLSCLDILIQVWTKEMKEGDKFILSKGHGAPALYVVLNYLKIISDKDFKTFHLEGTKLPAQPPNYYWQEYMPFPTGSLGHGLSLSSGIAQAFKFQKNKNRVFCLISDGECNEGQIWEAAQYASRFKLSNLILMIDKNGFQAMGKIKDVLGDSATRSKWESFGFRVYEADGHDLKQLSSVFKKVKKNNSDKPSVIIFNTIKGHGVSFMENKFSSHYQRLTQLEHKRAMEDLDHL
jgi:transketolase